MLYILAGGVLVVCAVVAFGLLLPLFWQWFQVGDSQSPQQSYWAVRSNAALSAFGVLLLTESIAIRPLVVSQFVVFHKENSLRYHVAAFAMIFTLMGISAITLVRAWRLRVRHMYYVVLRNAGWTKLMDASVENSLSFWVKYKALLTSERGVWATILVCVLLFVSATVGFSKDFDTFRRVTATTVLLICVATVALVFNIPKDPNCLRFELIFVATLNFLMMTSVLGFALAVSNDRRSEIGVLSTVTFMHPLIFASAFHLIPRRAAMKLRLESRVESAESHRTATQKVMDVFCDKQTLMDFAEHCCKHMCVENVLAIMEIKEFKRWLRKELTDSSMKATAVRSVVAAFSTSSDRSLLTDSIPSKHKKLFERASDIRQLSFTANAGENWTRWDLQTTVKLSEMGCQSSIVSCSGDARSKALALCNKYFECDSEFELNIGYEKREKVLSLVGLEADGELEPVALLFIFDEALADVFQNLKDVLWRFERMKATEF